MSNEAPLVILAGTMCLMSHYARTGCSRAAARIVVNLEMLAHHAGVSAEFRQVCANLTESWDCIINDWSGTDGPEKMRPWLARNAKLQ